MSEAKQPMVRRARPADADFPIIPDCPACRQSPLDLVQPDEHDPEIVIGQCPRCACLFAVAPLADAVGWDDGPGGWAVVARVGLLAAG